MRTKIMYVSEVIASFRRSTVSFRGAIYLISNSYSSILEKKKEKKRKRNNKKHMHTEITIKPE